VSRGGAAGAVLNDIDHIDTVDAIDGIDAAELSDEDRARILTTFLGVPSDSVGALHGARVSPHGQAPAYAFDEETGMVYILD